MLYKLFGEHEFILRLITISIVSFGFFTLFKLLILLLNDILYAFIFSFLFLSSTVLLYYTNNFLPDASALGFTLMGWYYFHLFNDQNSKYLFLSFSFFTISSLLKVTYFINPIAAISTIIFSDILAKKKLIDLFKTNFRLLIIFLTSSLVLLIWNIFVIRYNAANKDFYFLVGSRPIWDLDRNSINEVWNYIAKYWYSKYYYQSTIHFFVIIFILGIVFIKNATKKILIPGFVLFIGSVFYVLLFYAQFRDHDYYFITLIPTIIFLVINAFITIRTKFPRLLNNYFAKILLFGLTLLSLNYVKEKLEVRYSDKDDKFAEIGLTLSKTEQSIDSLGIDKNAKFIVFADKTPNGGLYFLNRKGWNIRDTTEAYINKINDYKYLGAEYLVNTTNINFNFPIIWTNSQLRIYKIR